MALGIAETKLAVDLLSKLLAWVKKQFEGKRVSREIDTLLSEGHRELLRDNVNLHKVESIIARLERLGDSSAEGYRLQDSYSRVTKKHAPKKRAAKAAAKKAGAKKTASKKSAAKKTTSKKSAAKKASAKAVAKKSAAKAAKKSSAK